MLDYGVAAAIASAALFIIGAILAFSSILRRNPYTFGLILTLVVWTFSQTLGGVYPDLNFKRVLVYVEYSALVFVPPWLMAMSLSFVGVRRRKEIIWSLFATSAAFASLVISSISTGFIVTNIRFDTALQRFLNDKGVLYPFYLTYILTGVAAACAVMLSKIRELPRTQKSRTVLMVIATLVPTVAGVLQVFGWNPFKGVPILNIALVISALLLLAGIFRGKLLSPLPLAHETVVAAMNEAVLVADDQNYLIYLNPAAAALDARRPLKVGTPIVDVFPELEAALGSRKKQVMDSAVNVTLSSGNYLLRRTTVSDAGSMGQVHVLVLTDVTNIHRNMSLLEESLEDKTKSLEKTNAALQAEVEKSYETQLALENLVGEKELLLRELHHRVKNNLQIIMSLINLQSNRLEGDTKTKEIYGAMKNRIRSISLVHERMYRSSFYSGVDFVEYVEELVRSIASLYEIRDAVARVEAPVRTFRASVDFSVDFGLVVNELVTNAFKHAVAPRGEGEIVVRIETTDNEFTISVSDSGPGFAEGDAGPASLGLNIVRAMAKKYDAQVEISKGRGACITLRVTLDPSTVDVVPGALA